MLQRLKEGKIESLRQLIYDAAEFNLVESFDATDRGEGGFGHSGRK